MNSKQFEALSSNLVQFQTKVRDEASLLRTACALLGALGGLLISRASGMRVLAAYPENWLEWGSRNLSLLRQWYERDAERLLGKGSALEGPQEIEGIRFGDALVAFGGMASQFQASTFECLLFQKEGGEPYRSYHVWAVGGLLRHFEHIQNARLFEQERLLAQQYSRSLSREVLRDEPWERFVGRLPLQTAGVDPSFLWMQAVRWTAFRVREITAGTSTLVAEPDSALRWLQEKGMAEAEESIYSVVIHLLLSRKVIGPGTLPILSGVIETYAASSGESVDRESLKAVVLSFEHIWRKLRKEASGAESATATLPTVPSSVAERDDLVGLLEISGRLLIAWLHVHSRCVAEDQTPQQPADTLCNVGRDELRFYLAALLLRSLRLRSSYLGLHDGAYTHEQPLQVQRIFLLNLARFMLDVMVRLEQQLGLDNEPRVVSQVEVLDSLLYLVDRYVHIELKVDERLNLRKTLGRSVPTEVKHYLTSPYYRDHLLHVLDVFLLGHLLLSSRIRWRGSYIPLMDHFAQLGVDKDRPQGHAEWLKQWAVAALFHDIGYQLGRGRVAAKDETWRDFFALRGEIGAAPLNAQGTKSRDRRKFVREFVGYLKETKGDGGWLPDCNENELEDHGVLSALRVAQVLLHAQAGDSRNDDTVHRSLVKEYQWGLHAMAHHNLFNRTILLSTHPLSWLLRLCDELQEWGRRRVNIERMVKQLYLDIQDDRQELFGANDNLERFGINLRFEAPVELHDEEIAVCVSGEEARLCFNLRYWNPLKTGFEATITFLSKTYNLQHLDLSLEHGHERDQLRVQLELQFPCPLEYNGLTEYDIYCLFVDQARSLPLLPSYPSIRTAAPGLVRLEENRTQGWDRIGIVLQGSTREREAWLPLNPACYYKEFVDFKERILNAQGHAVPGE